MSSKDIAIRAPRARPVYVAVSRTNSGNLYEVVMIEALSSHRPAAHVRAVIVEDHGDDLIIEFSSKRGLTRIHVDKSEIVSVEEMARHAIFKR